MEAATAKTNTTTSASIGEKGRKAIPPNRLPSVPRIYLSTGRERICLLPDEVCLSGASNQSYSLPNLALAADLQSLALQNGKNITKPGHEEGRTRPQGKDLGPSCDLNHQSNGASGRSKAERRRSGPQLLAGSQLSVYCSPRVSRRGVDWSPGDGEGRGGEYPWLKGSVSPRRRNRRGSNSSAESDSSLRSASHVSTCATSDYTRFTSCDALSLANDISPLASFPLGRLRRIYSNPETPMLNAENESQMRDSKSCSALEGDNAAAMVNYLLLEQTLSKEGTHLLSPPTIIPAGVLKKLAEAKGQNMPYERIYDEALKSYLGETGMGDEELTNRDNRIRQWLNNVSSSPSPQPCNDVSKTTLGDS